MKNVTKFGVLAGLMITIFSGCGVKYVEKGFGGGCEHHTANLNVTDKSNSKNHDLANSKTEEVSNPVELENSQIITNANSDSKSCELSTFQKLKLANHIRKMAKNEMISPKNNSSKQRQNMNLSQKNSELKSIVKSQKSGIDTSIEGLLKLILLILLALLVVGLLQMILGSGLVSLLTLVLLIYLILVYLI